MQNQDATQENIDVKNLCSRKLWELININSPSRVKSYQFKLIENELVARRHYLQELETLKSESYLPISHH